MATTKNLLEFESGDTSCCCEYGKFCMFLRTRRYGTIYMCDLFGKEVVDQEQLARLPECLEKFNKK
jgi:hypothetical protein